MAKSLDDDCMKSYLTYMNTNEALDALVGDLGLYLLECINNENCKMTSYGTASSASADGNTVVLCADDKKPIEFPSNREKYTYTSLIEYLQNK